MGVSLGEKILEINAEGPGGTLDLQNYLHEDGGIKSLEEAKEKAEMIQSFAADGFIDSRETKALIDEFEPVYGKKNVATQLSAITGSNQGAIWNRQFQYLKNNLIVRPDQKQNTWLMQDTVVQGIPLKGNQTIEVFADGRWLKGVLSQDASIPISSTDTCLFAKDTPIEVERNPESGVNVVRGTLAQDYQGIPRGSQVSFYGDSLNSVVLSQDAMVEGRHFPKGTRLSWGDGRLWAAEIPRHVKKDGEAILKIETLRFDEDGQVIAKR